MEMTSLTSKETEEKICLVDVAPLRRIRYLTAFLTTLAATVAFSMRVTLSIAIVGMTNNDTNTDFETFDWDANIKSTALSSFFWGYIVTNIPFGVVMSRYGPRWILLGSMIVCTIATYLIPIAAHLGGWQALVALRVIQGLSQGAVFPATHGLLAKWAPVTERGRLGSMCLAGMQIGNILTLPASGALASSDGGWPSIFYVFGSLGVVWCILWYFFGFNSPAEHPYITKTETEYIESFCVKQTKIGFAETPWKALVTSLPMWAIIISHFCQNWGFYMILSEMPTYMNDILVYNITDNGLLTSLPYVAMLLVIFTAGWFSDLLISKQIIKMSTSRKLFNAIGFLVPMVMMIGLTFVGQAEKEVAVALLVLSAGINGCVYVGFTLSHLDMAPNYAGILMAITNSIGNVSSLVVPYAVSAIVTEKNSEEQWQTVFWVTAGVYLFGTIVFTAFSSAEQQPWNKRKNLT